MWRIRIAHSALSAFRGNHLHDKNTALKQKIVDLKRQATQTALRRVKSVLLMLWRYKAARDIAMRLQRWLHRAARAHRQMISTFVGIKSLARAARTEERRMTMSVLADWRIRSRRALTLGVVARPLFVAGFVLGAQKTTPRADCDRIGKYSICYCSDT